VLANTELSHARRIHQQDLMPALAQAGMNVPRLAARLDRNSCWLRFRTEQGFESAQRADGCSLHDLSVGDFTKRDLLCT
jgi:hypothetical protein